jgi:diguanylate cyclase (GGDEF)-like protein
VARSWDARVKGASQKVETPEGEELEREFADPERKASARADGPKIESKSELAKSELAKTPSDEGDASFSAEIVSTGMSLAINAVELPAVVVERSTGLIHWMSEAWAERFGEQTHLARYMPSSTDLGESPLPPPHEAWQRTRTITYAGGTEDLAELLLLGARAADGSEVVTVVAIDRSGSGSIVTDRAEAISFVDGALNDASQGSVAVLYIDLDRFKVVHDLVGNVEALRLLDLISRRIGATVRGSDLLFRLPSDEFVVVACELEHRAVAEELAERIRSAIATLADVGQNMALTASIGVALADGEVGGDELLSAAETAVYLAKGRGRNRVAIHDEELRTRSERLLTVERQLRRAIEQRDVRFAYQPVVDLATGAVVGAEALLRLGGEIGLSAVEVVAAAEHSGLMGRLGTLVLEGVEEQLASLINRHDTNELIMVNLSATQLADEGLAATLRRLVDDVRIPANRLAVEVPEVVVREHRAAFVGLAELIQPKFKLGIDGFGTSYSSLEVLDGLSIDYVKLHRSITTSVGSEESARQEVGDLISTVGALGITVVALGVERQDQAAILDTLGCSFAQGFLYAGAVTAEDLMELFANGFVDAPRP